MYRQLEDIYNIQEIVRYWKSVNLDNAAKMLTT